MVYICYKINYDKPAYVGMAILDLSKVFMTGFHDDVVHTKMKEDVIDYTPIPIA